MPERSFCRLDGCESGRVGRTWDALLAGVGCDGKFLLSGREGMEDGCIGGPGLLVGLTAPPSRCGKLEVLDSGRFGTGLDVIVSS